MPQQNLLSSVAHDAEADENIPAPNRQYWALQDGISDVAEGRLLMELREDYYPSGVCGHWWWFFVVVVFEFE